ncbi:hypothetical protein H9I48_02775 [Wolbachia pipientis]|uniref:hypothetical protein n=1 Tax=Wolbachia pipientis TaxID=955 RepID=UPI00165120EC|nr:hypothetical protein [Wolbachia pipientis]MBC6686159.1 hypothetical protein [Wolbachia pipientis]
MSTFNLKVPVAALSLCVSAVAIYIHLPYVIAAVSGSGAIEAVPLAIFTVSAVIALASVAYLIKLAVSRAGDKKKIDLSGEESGHTASQVPQEKSVKQDSGSQIKVDSGTGSQDKSSVPTSPSQSSQTRDTAVPQVSQEKSVKQDSRLQTDVAKAIPQNNNASSPSTSGGAPPPPPPPPPPSSNGTPLPKKANSPSDPNVKPDISAMLNQIKQGQKLMSKEERDKKLEKQAAKKLGSNRDQQQQNLDDNLEKMLIKRAIAMALSESGGSDRTNSWISSEDEHKQTEPDQAEKELTKHTNPPSSKEESCGPDSGAGSKAMSLLERLAVLPYFFADSPSTVQVDNVDPVNSEIQDPSALSAKEHTKHLNSQRGTPVLSY